MAEQVYITLLSISGAIILLLISVLGYFLHRIIKVVDNFDLTLRNFSEDYATTKERINNSSVNCREKHEIINHRLNEHGSRLDEHEKDIEVIKIRL